MTARTLDEAIEESRAALDAISKGDVGLYMALYSDGQDVTLGNPFGPFVRGREDIQATGERAASNYRDGQILDSTEWRRTSPTGWPAWLR